MKRLLPLMLVISFAACEEPSTDPLCPDLTGDWTITEHCETSFVGSVASTTQSACVITTDWGMGTGTGTVSTDDEITMTVDIGGGTTLTCTGNVTGGDTLTLDCEPGACHVVLER